MIDERGEWSETAAGSSSVVLSFLLGGLTGAALVLLFTPRSGREMRYLIGEKVREGEQLAERALERGRRIVEKVDSIRRPRESAASAYEEQPADRPETPAAPQPEGRPL
jgi:gas vesicle protein